MYMDGIINNLRADQFRNTTAGWKENTTEVLLSEEIVAFTHSLSPAPKPPTIHKRSSRVTSDLAALPGISLAMTEGGLDWLVLTCWWVII